MPNNMLVLEICQVETLLVSKRSQNLQTQHLSEAGVEAEFVYKISEGRPNVEDRLKNGDIALVINTSDTKSSVDDGKKIRQNVLRFKIPYFTTIRAALAAAKSLSTVQTGKALEVKSLQEYLSEKQ